MGGSLKTTASIGCPFLLVVVGDLFSPLSVSSGLALGAYDTD